MKTLLAVWASLLFCLPAASQIAPLRPRYVQVDTSAYDAARAYALGADSLLKIRAARIIALEQQAKVLTGQVQNRVQEVERERDVSNQLRVDKVQLRATLDKALALPLRPPFYADTRALGLGALALVVGILLGKH